MADYARFNCTAMTISVRDDGPPAQRRAGPMGDVEPQQQTIPDNARIFLQAKRIMLIKTRPLC
jgi:hypothetical protein